MSAPAITLIFEDDEILAKQILAHLNTLGYDASLSAVPLQQIGVAIERLHPDMIFLNMQSRNKFDVADTLIDMALDKCRFVELTIDLAIACTMAEHQPVQPN
jgi:hypothetical protein